MTPEQKAKAYDKALEKARKELKACGSLDCDAARQIFRLFPELNEEEKPLTPFQQCLNCILRGVYYAEVPDEKVNEFIVNIVRTRTDELIKLAKIHEYIDCQLKESKDERIRKDIVALIKFALEDGSAVSPGSHTTKEEALDWLEKQKEQNGEDEECTDFTIYHPLKNGKGKYECIPHSFYGSLTSFEGGKDLIDFLHTCFYTEEECNEWIKQQEQKELPPIVGDTDAYFEDLRMTTKPLTSREWFDEGMKYAQRLQKEQKPWSEENEEMLNSCISSIEEAKENRYAYKETDGDTSYDHEIDWLKSLRPCSSWKPSEEQMNGLETAIVRCQMTGLESLYEDLKKLM